MKDKEPPSALQSQQSVAAKLLEFPASARVSKINELVRKLEDFHRSDVNKKLDLHLARLQTNKENAKNRFVEKTLHDWNEVRTTILREDLVQRLNGFPHAKELLLAHDKLCQQQLLDERRRVEHEFEKTYHDLKNDLQAAFRETFRLPELRKQIVTRLIAAFDTPDPAETIIAVLSSWDDEISQMWKKISVYAQTQTETAVANLKKRMP